MTWKYLPQNLNGESLRIQLVLFPFLIHLRLLIMTRWCLEIFCGTTGDLVVIDNILLIVLSYWSIFKGDYRRSGYYLAGSSFWM